MFFETPYIDHPKCCFWQFVNAMFFRIEFCTQNLVSECQNYACGGLAKIVNPYEKEGKQQLWWNFHFFSNYIIICISVKNWVILTSKKRKIIRIECWTQWNTQTKRIMLVAPGMGCVYGAYHKRYKHLGEYNMCVVESKNHVFETWYLTSKNVLSVHLKLHYYVKFDFLPKSGLGMSK